MPKQPSINWRSSDSERVKRIAKNFNAKVRRLEKKGLPADIIPKRITYTEIRNNVVNRAQLNRILNSAQRFLKRGSEQITGTTDKGLPQTKWQRREYQIYRSAINRSRNVKMNEVMNTEATSQGKPVGLKRGEMGDTRTNELRPKKSTLNKMSSREEWERAIDSMERELTRHYNDEAYKDNYLKALDAAFGDSPDDELLFMYKSLRYHIEHMPAYDVVEVYFASEEASIGFILYDETGEARFTSIEGLYSSWGLNYNEVNSLYDEMD